MCMYVCMRWNCVYVGIVFVFVFGVCVGIVFVFGVCVGIVMTCFCVCQNDSPISFALALNSFVRSFGLLWIKSLRGFQIKKKHTHTHKNRCIHAYVHKHTNTHTGTPSRETTLGLTVAYSNGLIIICSSCSCIRWCYCNIFCRHD
jgi:hypothetical protein